MLLIEDRSNQRRKYPVKKTKVLVSSEKAEEWTAILEEMGMISIVAVKPDNMETLAEIATAACDNLPFGLLLMEELPRHKPNAFDLLQVIRGHLNEIPMIIVCGHLTPDKETRAASLRFAKAIEAPFNAEGLQLAIKAVSGHRRH
jgi:DNA-binding NtrC family response regulator